MDAERHGAAVEPPIYADIRQANAADPGGELDRELVREAFRQAREGEWDGTVRQQASQ